MTRTNPLLPHYIGTIAYSLPKPPSVPVLGMEYQSAHLDALAGRDIGALGRRVHEGAVGDAAGAAVGLAVEALDEQDLGGRETVLVEPALVRVMADRKGLAAPCGIDELLIPCRGQL